jgi:hypothetical protein
MTENAAREIVLVRRRSPLWQYWTEAVVIFLRCLIVALALTYCGIAVAQQTNGGQQIMQPPRPPPPTRTRTLTLTFAPQVPSIPASTPLGTVVATVTAAWSDGSAFTGTLMFGAPYYDDGGTFALSCMQCATANIVVNPAGLGVMGDGGTVQKVTVVATGQTARANLSVQILPVGSGPSLVRTALAHGSGRLNSNMKNGQLCVWQMPQAISAGDTVVGYGHFANAADYLPMYPQQIYDNAGNNYTISPGVDWHPWVESEMAFYITNVQGNPNTITFDFSQYPDNGTGPSETSIGTFCDVGFAEYSGASSVLVLANPIQITGTAFPSITFTTNSSGLIWVLAATMEGSTGPGGYSILLDDYPTDDMGVWQSNSIVSPGTYTLRFYNPLGDPSYACAGLGDGVVAGCPSVLGVLGIYP